MIDGKTTTGNYGITDEKKDYQNTPISITLTFDKTYKVSFQDRNEKEVEHIIIKNY